MIFLIIFFDEKMDGDTKCTMSQVNNRLIINSWRAARQIQRRQNNKSGKLNGIINNTIGSRRDSS